MSQKVFQFGSIDAATMVTYRIFELSKKTDQSKTTPFLPHYYKRYFVLFKQFNFIHYKIRLQSPNIQIIYHSIGTKRWYICWLRLQDTADIPLTQTPRRSSSLVQVIHRVQLLDWNLEDTDEQRKELRPLLVSISLDQKHGEGDKVMDGSIQENVLIDNLTKHMAHR